MAPLAFVLLAFWSLLTFVVLFSPAGYYILAVVVFVLPCFALCPDNGIRPTLCVALTVDFANPVAMFFCPALDVFLVALTVFANLVRVRLCLFFLFELVVVQVLLTPFFLLRWPRSSLMHLLFLELRKGAYVLRSKFPNLAFYTFILNLMVC